MNPIFTLNYPELLVAEHLQANFPKRKDYSVLIPLSAQQKGYDLALMHRCRNRSKVVTFQVKSSKTYVHTPGISKRSGMTTFAYNMWLGRFKVPSEADFIVLHGLYAYSPTSLKNTTGVWKSQMLLFTHAEMISFIGSLRQRRTAKSDTHFAFGFNKPHEAFLTRGHALIEHPDFSKHLMSNRLSVIQKALSCS